MEKIFCIFCDAWADGDEGIMGYSIGEKFMCGGCANRLKEIIEGV